MQTIYAADGVNVQEGDSFSSFAAGICRESYHNSPFVEVKDFSRGHFRGPRGVTFKNLPEGYYLDVAPDGIGTKVNIITAAMSQETAGRDVMAMTLFDITRWGGLPLLFSNVYDVATLGENGSATNNAHRAAFTGLGAAAKEQGIVLYKGETAELGICVGSDDPEAITKFNWAGFAVGVYDEKRVINGDTLRAGQKIIALAENGFRSNGISSVRKALAMKFGRDWWNNPHAEEAIKAAATPSILYDKFLTTANGWHNPSFEPLFKMHLIVHVTGGAFKSKLAEDILFPRGLSAELDNLWSPPDIMKFCAEWRRMDDEECFQTWHGGQGALVVIDENDVNNFLHMAAVYGIKAQTCGTITQEDKPSVTIRSHFNDGKVITYNA